MAAKGLEKEGDTLCWERDEGPLVRGFIGAFGKARATSCCSPPPPHFF